MTMLKDLRATYSRFEGLVDEFVLLGEEDDPAVKALHKEAVWVDSASIEALFSVWARLVDMKELEVVEEGGHWIVRWSEDNGTVCG